MQNTKPKHRARFLQPRSITFRILLIIFGTNLIILGLYFSVNYKLLTRDQFDACSTQQKLLSQYLQTTLSIPVITLDEQQIKHIITSFMAAKEIQAILLKDESTNSPTLFGLLKVDNTLKPIDSMPEMFDGTLVTLGIQYQDKNIASLKILFTDKHLRSYLHNTLIVKISALSLLIIFMSFIVYLGLKKHVIGPLNRLEKFARRIGDDEMTVTPISTRFCSIEMEHVQNAMNQMLLQLQRRFHELESSQQELQQSRSELEQAQKMKAIGALAGGIAHDFNNALQTILGLTELLQRKVQKDFPYSEDLNNILKATYKARDLVKTILTFSHKSELNIQHRDCRTTLIECQKPLRSMIPSTIDIKWELEDDLGLIKIDDSAIMRVLMNLFSNSQHAIGDKQGFIKVEAKKVPLTAAKQQTTSPRAPTWNVQIDVSDDGCGIPDEIKKSIFVPFVTSKKKGEGTGIGLSMVYRLVHDMDGQIKVSSRVGIGTVFSITLPAWEGNLVGEQEEIQDPPQGKERILFVDDEPEICENWKDLLSNLGYTVTACSNSRDALRLFQQNPDGFDALITDYTMPNLNGMELARTAIAIRPSLPIILCTGYSARVDKESARLEGIRAFFHKPVTLLRLAKELRSLLDETY